ncbi:DNA-binding response regulator, OmpR family, contains REC and winged-helix (wHTH) domain [Fictibacillus solisalsi]|uniref:DNA-binding response regulator, OmpR family, contains REC and winged-helix (WHTH) domain n=1 Tax=Fictibacillus solisalsi TaxID=459525 RepID=A0A1G9WKJ0_9BACL|nr:response regulator transcription factor [Fictibacillus solisalsi]SDM84989.1 DNA-binding response regulator, OmpR family, contains REC and winged-helix (wHTH) domain [Fictibacillus solisalsi]
MKTVLIVDDEEKILEVVSSYLRNEGYRTIETSTGQEALQYIRKRHIDFVILDLMLPDYSGEDICQSIRQETSLPILMLTAKAKETERIKGLSLGADDYMVKPFSPRELVMRVKTILRRSNDNDLLAEQISYNQGELIVNAKSKEVFSKGNSISLTPIEYKALLFFARHPKRTFTRDELVEKVLGYDYEGETRTIDQHIKNLRQKIENNPKEPRYIQTVFGMGYKFEGNRNEN